MTTPFPKKREPATDPSARKRSVRTLPVAAPAAVLPSAGGRPRLLVVDDEELIRKVLVRGFKDYEVTALEDARAAVKLLEAGERFEAILSDLMMPGMSGMAFYAQVARVAPDQLERVIFVTSGGTTAETRGFLARIPNPIVDKPFVLQALQELVRSQMKKRGIPAPPRL